MEREGKISLFSRTCQNLSIIPRTEFPLKSKREPQGVPLHAAASLQLIIHFSADGRALNRPLAINRLPFRQRPTLHHCSAHPATLFRLASATHVRVALNRLPPLTHRNRCQQGNHPPSGKCGQILCTKIPEIKSFLDEPRRGTAQPLESRLAIEVEKELSRCSPPS